MGTPFKNPPVFMTLAQVKFNAVLKLNDFLPPIQEQFRKAGFPDFQPQIATAIRIELPEAQGNSLPFVPQPIQQQRFIFGNPEKTCMFILEAGALTVQSTDYGCSEKFLPLFLEGLEFVHSAVGLAYSERIGLRYLDRVMPRANEHINQYLADPIQGLGEKLGGKPLQFYTEALNQIGDIQLLSRIVIQDSPMIYPADIQPSNLIIASRFLDYTGPSALLDNDGFMDRRETFSTAGIAEHLKAIHKVTSNAFKVTCTDFAIEAWNQA